MSVITFPHHTLFDGDLRALARARLRLLRSQPTDRPTGLFGGRRVRHMAGDEIALLSQFLAGGRGLAPGEVAALRSKG